MDNLISWRVQVYTSAFRPVCGSVTGLEMPRVYSCVILSFSPHLPTSIYPFSKSPTTISTGTPYPVLSSLRVDFLVIRIVLLEQVNAMHGKILERNWYYNTCLAHAMKVRRRKMQSIN
ncbi:unnamed protein product [Somion occarium]|uniref:Uncharacterized protein n=1 Tax=Somion occarium TaxID=3059160 RepID=A0ABP1CN48_9APHY